QYDMVFLDVVMPEMDGYTLCRKIKMMPAYKRIPVVLLTSRDSTTDRVHGLMAGCSRYLTKPLRPGELDELLASLCPLDSTNRAGKEFGQWQTMASSAST
ncbi:MAG TPA: response regulator, partial [Gammaproteobacteria bacterium]